MPCAAIAALGWGAGLLTAPRADAQILTGSLGQLTGPSQPGWPTLVGGNVNNPSGVGPGAIMGESRRFRYAFTLNLSAYYDDNIFIRNSNKTGDWAFLVEPHFIVGWGDIFGRGGNYVRLEYVPGFTFFARNSDQNNVEHQVRLTSVYTFSKLSVSVGQSVQILHGADTDVGTRISRNIYQTTLGLSYALTGKTSVDLGLVYTLNSIQNQVDSDSIGGSLYVNYNPGGKWTFGLGGNVTLTRVDGPFSPDQLSEQINFRANYQATGKVSFNGSVGLEFRQFDGARNQIIDPVFEIGAVYQPFDGTTFTLRAGRRTQNSAILVGQNFTTTSIAVSARQRFLQRIFVTGSVAYEKSDYHSNFRGLTSGRTDDFVTFSLNADYNVREGLTVGAFYTHRENTGNSLSQPFVFSNNQYGVRATVSF